MLLSHNLKNDLHEVEVIYKNGDKIKFNYQTGEVISSSKAEDAEKTGLFDYLKEYSIDTSVEVNKIEYVSVKNNYIYNIQGKLNEMTFDTTNVIDNDFRIIVIVDFDNSTYAVYPLSDKDDYKKIIDSIKKINIDSNSNNRTIKSDLITKEKICVLYLSDYVNKLNYDIEEAYKLLDDTTKKNYSLEKFISYINNNFDKITTDADKCLFETVGDKRIYTVID